MHIFTFIIHLLQFQIQMAKPPTPNTSLPCCFSFAAYSKTLINQLRNLNIPILPGLSDHEFSALESSLRFSFPPDLRSILEVGLPAGPHFPNWRSSSPQQLQILLNLPFLHLSSIISRSNFWLDSWGRKPKDRDRAIAIAKKFFDKAPVLVPIYANCYIPAVPNAAGNPIFYVDDRGVRVLSFDISRFFQDFLRTGGVRLTESVRSPMNVENSVNVPAWAAKEARRVGFWTEVAEARGGTRGWWSKGGDLEVCLDGVFWRLRDGGWKEEEVREMMMMTTKMDGCDDEMDRESGAQDDDVASQVGELSVVLLRGGWSTEDVVDSLDVVDESVAINGCFDLQIRRGGCLTVDDDCQKNRIKPLVNLPRSVKV